MSQRYVFPVVRRTLEDYYQEVLTYCVKCGFCRNVFPPDTRDARFAYQCPSGEVFKFEAYYASGRNEVIRALLEGEIEWSDRVRHIIYTCTTCGACDVWCQFSGRGHPLWAIEKLREYAVEIGQGPMPAHKRFAESIKMYHNPYNEPHEKRFAWMPADVALPTAPPVRAETVYFVGCTSSYRRMEIAQATVRVLSSLKVPFALMGGEEWCCGSPLFRTGQVRAGIETLMHNLEVFRKIGAKRVLVSCAGCYRTLKEAPVYGLDLPVEVMHVTELVAQMIGEGKVALKEKLGEKLTYHDPCHLRHFRVFEPPREVLTYIGVELVEMPRNRLNSFCCGYGGGVASAFPDLAREVATLRLTEAEASGVKTITSICPFCKLNFSRTIEDRGLDMKVYDVMELLARAMGL
jgi:heterodisulfide reductase subunit D